MEGIITLVLLPIAAGIIVLIVEYQIIRPKYGDPPGPTPGAGQRPPNVKHENPGTVAPTIAPEDAAYGLYGQVSLALLVDKIEVKLGELELAKRWINVKVKINKPTRTARVKVARSPHGKCIVEWRNDWDGWRYYDVDDIPYNIGYYDATLAEVDDVSVDLDFYVNGRDSSTHVTADLSVKSQGTVKKVLQKNGLSGRAETIRFLPRNPP